MFFIYAELRNDESDYNDEIMIGLFTTPEKAISAAREWVKEEREGESTDDICLCGWLCEPDSSKIERIDLYNKDECKFIVSEFRKIEKEFPPFNS